LEDEVNCSSDGRGCARFPLLRLCSRGAFQLKSPTALVALALATWVGLSCRSQARAEDVYREIETKYIFGFTEGSGIGLEGEKEFSPDTVVNSGKRDGHYTAAETELKFEYTPNQFVQFEFGPIATYHDIQNVTGLENVNSGTFGGFFGEFRYLLLDRGASSPLALTLSIEPEWHNIDETSGQGVVNYGLETALNGDVEIIKNRGYFGFNLLYEPERTLTQDGTSEQETTLGLSGALAYRIFPNTTIGAETWYLRHYADFGLDSFTGDAVYVGPNIYVQITPKMFVTFAWNTQVAGHEAAAPGNLDLTDFSRNRFKIKTSIEF
jgi:hypothetical protein